MMQIRYLAALAIVPAVLSAQAAYADTRTSADNATGRMLEAISECRKISNDPSRLACFERFATSLETSIGKEDFKIVDKNDVKNIKKSLFGFALPRVDLFGSKEPFVEINSTIASVRPVNNDRIQITLSDDDATWQTTDPVNFPPKPGSAVRIKKGALGNYFIFVDGKNYRGARIR
ncbi:MAG: hypothetical protein P0Y64_10520 [Candidatus Sphingomonas colombiensis]|nr:hypothetical protein [Sphingomonas sp.]WEK41842.1 MAG: hypothetical protein P0Y64_10520 [Sphingomonas sp.]